MRSLISSRIAVLCLVVLFVFLPAVGSALAQQYDVIYRFKGGSDGANAEGDLLSDSASNLYGATGGGGTAGFGTIYQLIPPSSGDSWTKTLIYSFKAGVDGEYPLAGLVRDSSGNLYGSTFEGGTKGLGTVFEVSPPAAPGGAWTETILHNFTGQNDGSKPQCKLLLKGGALFGTAFSGGVNGVGVVFKLRPSTTGGPWIEQVLYSFTGGSDGGEPWPGLTADTSGNLYGVTLEDGVNGNGTAFELSPPATPGAPWTETTLHSFGPSEGENPVAELLVDHSGNVYGMTSVGPADTGFGGGYGCGVIFQLVPPSVAGGDWTENQLYTLTGSSDGCNPYSGLIFDSAGNLVGANSGDSGGNGNGAIFELSPPTVTGGAWTETTLHGFVGGNDGLYSYSTLIVGKGGALYGATTGGGGGKNGGFGTVFQLRP